MKNYPHKRGRYTDQAHVRVPAGTFELEHAREGFFSEEASHLYVTQPPSNWKRIEGDLRPRAVDCRPMVTADSEDPNALPTQLLSAAVWCSSMRRIRLWANVIQERAIPGFPGASTR